jgi:hypothetical protein
LESSELLADFGSFFCAVLAAAGFFRAVFPGDVLASDGLVPFDGASKLCFLFLGRLFARLVFFFAEDDSFDTEVDDDTELCFFFLGRPFARFTFFGSEDDSLDTEFNDASELCFSFLGRLFARFAFFGCKDDSFDTESSELLVDGDDDDEDDLRRLFRLPGLFWNSSSRSSNNLAASVSEMPPNMESFNLQYWKWKR